MSAQDYRALGGTVVYGALLFWAAITPAAGWAFFLLLGGGLGLLLLYPRGKS